jgi:hypothetical protein
MGDSRNASRGIRDSVALSAFRGIVVQRPLEEKIREKANLANIEEVVFFTRKKSPEGGKNPARSERPLFDSGDALCGTR